MSGKLVKILHKFMVTLCAAQLTVITTPVMAQPVPGSGNIINEDASFGGDVGMALLDVVNQGAQTYLQAKQQSFAALQQASLFQQLAPTTEFDMYFGCPIPSSESAFVQNACENDITNDGELSTYMALQSIADGYDDYYTKLSNPAQNTRTPLGLQCIETAKQKVLDGMTKKLNDLIELRAQLEKSQQQFRDDQQQLLEDMDGLNNQLKGQPSEKAGENTTTFRDEMGDDCSNILGNVGINIDEAHKKRSGGLIGMLSKMQKPNLDAANYARDAGDIEGEINSVIESIKNDIARDGIDNWGGGGDQTTSGAYYNNLFRGKSKFQAAVLGSVANQKKIFDSKVKQLRAEIKRADPSFSLPGLDKNFSVDMDDFIAGADAHYKRKFVNDCMTGGEGLGLSGNAILQSLYQPTSKSKETKTLRDYRRALQGIMNSDMSYEQKEIEIQALDQTYKGAIKMRFEDTQSRTQENVTAYDYFNQYRKDCETRYNEDDTHEPGAGGIGNRSAATKTKRAVAALRKLKNEISSYSERIAADISNQLNSCNGAELKSNKCGPDTINVSGADFCIPHANQCAAKIKACFKKVSDAVDFRKGQLNDKANSYNDRVENFVANQEQILQQIRGIVKTQETFISGFFESEAPLDAEKLFIGMPEFGDDIQGYGVRLRGKGQLDFMQELDKKLELVQGQIANQKGKLDTKLTEHMGNVQDQLMANQTRWKNLKTDCKTKEESYRAANDQNNAAIAKQNQEIDQNVGNFCRRFDSLSQVNPGPGCDGSNSPEKLFEEMNDVAGHINPRVSQYISAYRNVCSSINNTSDDEDSNTSDLAPLYDACKKNGNNWTSAYESIVNTFLDEVDENFDKSDGDKLEEYLVKDSEEFPEDDLSSAIKGTSFGRIAQEIKQMHPDRSSEAAAQLSRDLASENHTSFKTKLGEARTLMEEAMNKFPSSPSTLTETAAGFGSLKFPRTSGKDVSNFQSMADVINSDSDMMNSDITSTDISNFVSDGKAMVTKLAQAANSASSATDAVINRLKAEKAPLEQAVQAAITARDAASTAKADNITAHSGVVDGITPPFSITASQLETFLSDGTIPELDDPTIAGQVAAKFEEFKAANEPLQAALDAAEGKVTEAEEAMKAKDAAIATAESDKLGAENGAKQALEAANAVKAALNKLNGLDPKRDADAPSNDSRVTDSNDNLCRTLDAEIANAEKLISEQCSGASEKYDCIKRERENLQTKLSGVKTSLVSFNELLASIESVAVGTAKQEKEWRSIGERAQGICRGRSTASRNSLINQDVLQGMINPSGTPTLRNSIGVQ